MTAKKGRPAIELDRTTVVYFVKSGATKKYIQNYFGIAKSTLYQYLKNAPITEDELNLVEIKLTRPDMETSTIELVKKTNVNSTTKPVVKHPAEVQGVRNTGDMSDDIKPNQGKSKLAKLIADLENADDFYKT